MGNAMSDPHVAERAADREAADWHVRLGERPLAADTLAAFRTWRQVPTNAEAYRRVEAMWRSAGRLSTDADIQALTRETLRKTRRGTSGSWRRRLLPAAAVLAPVIIAAAFALHAWSPTRGLHTTAVGEQQVLRLEDGTRVTLDTATRLRVRFGASERRLILESGQALFDVAHDPERPFRVAAGSTEVVALGTVFGVRRTAGGARVTLVRGDVAVTDAAAGRGGAWRLEPGQRLETSRPDAGAVPVDAAVETSWSQGRLVFRQTPLREAVAEVNRYLPEKIVLAAEPVAGVPVNGVFAVGDRDAFVAAVSELFNLTVEPDPDGGVRLVSTIG
jgi:transmembrane sensor